MLSLLAPLEIYRTRPFPSPPRDVTRRGRGHREGDMSNFPLNLRLKQRSVLPSTGVTPLAKGLSNMAMQTPGGPSSQFPYGSQSQGGDVPSGNGSGPGPMSQQIPSSQGLGTQGFGGPDFITPQEAQFACVYDPNEKENLGMRSPANLSPGRHKRPRFGYDPTPSQPDPSQLGSQGPTMNPTPMSQGWNAGGSQSQAALSQGDFLQRATGGDSNSNGGEREGAFRMPPPRAPSRSGIVKAAKSPPCHRNAFMDDDEQPAEVPAHARVGGKDSVVSAAQMATMSRFRADFVDVGVVGRGGFCKVMRVIHRLDGATYAVKRTERKLQTHRERLEALREVQAMAALSGASPAPGLEHVVRYYGAWTERDRDGEHLFMQLELCDGTLASAQERAIELANAARDVPDDVGAQRMADDARFGERKIARVLRQIAAALACAHARNVAHLDVKPDNILVKNGVYKLGDWGRAAPVDGVGNQTFGTSGRSASVSVEDGDARYLAPELLRGEVRVEGSIHPSSRGGLGAAGEGAGGGSGMGEPDSPTVDDAMCSGGAFGSAQSAGAGGLNLSLPGDFVGLDRADIFSLGATAFELARGAPLPSHGDEYQALRQGKVPALRGFSVSFQQMVAGMMREDPTARPTARALLKSQALAEAEEDKPKSGGLFGA